MPTNPMTLFNCLCGVRNCSWEKNFKYSKHLYPENRDGAYKDFKPECVFRYGILGLLEIDHQRLFNRAIQKEIHHALVNTDAITVEPSINGLIIAGLSPVIPSTQVIEGWRDDFQHNTEIDSDINYHLNNRLASKISRTLFRYIKASRKKGVDVPLDQVRNASKSTEKVCFDNLKQGEHSERIFDKVLGINEFLRLMDDTKKQAQKDRLLDDRRQIRKGVEDEMARIAKNIRVGTDDGDDFLTRFQIMRDEDDLRRCLGISTGPVKPKDYKRKVSYVHATAKIAPDSPEWCGDKYVLANREEQRKHGRTDLPDDTTECDGTHIYAGKTLYDALLLCAMHWLGGNSSRPLVGLKRFHVAIVTVENPYYKHFTSFNVGVRVGTPNLTPDLWVEISWPELETKVIFSRKNASREIPYGISDTEYTPIENTKRRSEADQKRKKTEKRILKQLSIDMNDGTQNNTRLLSSSSGIGNNDDSDNDNSDNDNSDNDNSDDDNSDDDNSDDDNSDNDNSDNDDSDNDDSDNDNSDNDNSDNDDSNDDDSYDDDSDDDDVAMDHPNFRWTNRPVTSRSCRASDEHDSEEHDLDEDDSDVSVKLYDKRFGFDKALWDRMWEALKKFKNKFGHTCVPQLWSKNKSLGMWVSKMRHHLKLYNQNKSCNLDDYRVKKLKELNFGESNVLPNGGWTPTTNPEDFVQADREITGKDVLVVCGRRIGKSRRGVENRKYWLIMNECRREYKRLIHVFEKVHLVKQILEYIKIEGGFFRKTGNKIYQLPDGNVEQRIKDDFHKNNFPQWLNKTTETDKKIVEDFKKEVFPLWLDNSNSGDNADSTVDLYTEIHAPTESSTSAESSTSSRTLDIHNLLPDLGMLGNRTPRIPLNERRNPGTLSRSNPSPHLSTKPPPNEQSSLQRIEQKAKDASSTKIRKQRLHGNSVASSDQTQNMAITQKRACAECHKAKVKCERIEGKDMCVRCEQRGLKFVEHVSRQGQGKRRRKKVKTKMINKRDTVDDTRVQRRKKVKTKVINKRDTVDDARVQRLNDNFPLSVGNLASLPHTVTRSFEDPPPPPRRVSNIPPSPQSQSWSHRGHDHHYEQRSEYPYTQHRSFSQRAQPRFTLSSPDRRELQFYREEEELRRFREQRRSFQRQETATYSPSMVSSNHLIASRGQWTQNAQAYRGNEGNYRRFPQEPTPERYPSFNAPMRDHQNVPLSHSSSSAALPPHRRRQRETYQPSDRDFALHPRNSQRRRTANQHDYDGPDHESYLYRNLSDRNSPVDPQHNEQRRTVVDVIDLVSGDEGNA